MSDCAAVERLSLGILDPGAVARPYLAGTNRYDTENDSSFGETGRLASTLFFMMKHQLKYFMSSGLNDSRGPLNESVNVMV